MNRRKQIEITTEMVEQIERVTNTTINPDDIVVFEAAALSTKALHKPGSLYHGARPSRSMLEAMAAALNSGSESVPLHTMHQQASELPLGKVFSARLEDEIDGSITLRAMFYLPLAEKEMIEKINLSILDEVSVGVKAEQLLCSKCGFDYLGSESDFTNLFSQTCENGHTIGEDSTHLKMVGLDKWMELSLVSRGASNKPKILSRARQLVSQDEYDRMAADGTPLEALVLFTSTTMETPTMPDPETPKTPVEPVPATEASTETQEFDAKSAIEALTAKLDALTAKLAEPEPEPEPEPEVSVEDLQAQLAAAEAKIAELSEPPAEETPEPEPEAIEVPSGGVAASAVADAKSHEDTSLRASAFKTKRKTR